MTPADPSPDQAPLEQTPASPLPDLSPSPGAAPRDPFWDYQDLFFFLALCFPSLMVAFVVMTVIPSTALFGRSFQGLMMQLLWYVLVFSALLILFRVRYRRPFWSSLGWRFPFPGFLKVLLGGPTLAFAVAALGFAIRAPEIPMPFKQMLENRPTIILFSIFVVVLGPVSEELAFRGFLMPLLIRSFGATIGIVGTGILFGVLHSFEYAKSWRHVLLIAVAGTVFGWVRYRSGSTAASIFMHSTYNLTQLAAFFVQGGAA